MFEDVTTVASPVHNKQSSSGSSVSSGRSVIVYIQMLSYGLALESNISLDFTYVRILESNSSACQYSNYR